MSKPHGLHWGQGKHRPAQNTACRLHGDCKSSMVCLQLRGTWDCWPPSVLKGRRRPSVPPRRMLGGLEHTGWGAISSRQAYAGGQGSVYLDWCAAKVRGVPAPHGACRRPWELQGDNQQLHCCRGGEGTAVLHEGQRGMVGLGGTISVWNREGVTKGKSQEVQPSLRVKPSGPSKALELGTQLKSQELIRVQSCRASMGKWDFMHNSKFQEKLMLRMELISPKWVTTTENLLCLWYSVHTEGLRYNQGDYFTWIETRVKWTTR